MLVTRKHYPIVWSFYNEVSATSKSVRNPLSHPFLLTPA